MAHPKFEEVWLEGTVVRLKKTGEFALIKNRTFMLDGKHFLHYHGQIEGRGDGLWALYHDDLELECAPMSTLMST